MKTLTLVTEFWKPEDEELRSGATLHDEDAHKLGAENKYLQKIVLSNSRFGYWATPCLVK